MHDRPDRVIAPILPIHIDDMRFILKLLRQFADRAVHVIKRQLFLEIVILRDEDHIRFGQIFQLIARLGHIGIQHRAVVARPLGQRTGIFALNFNVIDFAGLIMRGNVQPYRPAAQILERILRFHLGDAQTVILQECADQELCTVNILKDHTHKRIIDQAKPLDLVIIAIFLSQSVLAHPHHVLVLSQSLYSIVYGNCVPFKGQVVKCCTRSQKPLTRRYLSPFPRENSVSELGEDSLYPTRNTVFRRSAKPSFFRKA